MKMLNMTTLLVLAVMSLVVGAAWAIKHTPLPEPLPPEMKTQPQQEPRIPTPPGERKQLEKPQPPQKDDRSRPVMTQPVQPVDLVRVSRMWTEPAQPVHGQRIKVKMRILNVSKRTLTDVGWTIKKVGGPGQFDSRWQFLPAFGPAPQSADVEVEWSATLGSHRFEGRADISNESAQNSTRALNRQGMPAETVLANNTMVQNVEVRPMMPPLR